MIEYSKVFVDTSPIIYYLDKGSNYDEAREFLTRSNARGLRMVTSVLTIEEYMVYINQMNSTQLEEDFYVFLKGMGIDVLPIREQDAIRAASLRIRYPELKRMDCIQLAIAITSKCDVFLTNDKDLRQVKEVQSIILSEMQLR